MSSRSVVAAMKTRSLSLRLSQLISVASMNQRSKQRQRCKSKASCPIGNPLISALVSMMPIELMPHLHSTVLLPRF